MLINVTLKVTSGKGPQDSVLGPSHTCINYLN